MRFASNSPPTAGSAPPAPASRMCLRWRARRRATRSLMPPALHDQDADGASAITADRWRRRSMAPGWRGAQAARRRVRWIMDASGSFSCFKPLSGRPIWSRARCAAPQRGPTAQTLTDGNMLIINNEPVSQFSPWMIASAQEVAHRKSRPARPSAAHRHVLSCERDDAISVSTMKLPMIWATSRSA